MTLANIEGSSGVFVLVVAILLVRWLGNRVAGNRADPKLNKQRLRRSAFALGVTGGSEEERMRRFLEALGIPADSPDAKRESTPPPMRSSQKSEPREKPVSRKPAESSFPKRQPPRENVPPLPKRPPATPLRPVEPPPLVPPATPSIPALHVRTLEPHERELPEEFQTMHSTVPVPPAETVIIRAGTEFRRTDAGTELWKEALRSPQALRSAVILQEILGPPRSLQSDKFPHSFRTL